jgi:hypothetical protein
VIAMRLTCGIVPPMGPGVAGELRAMREALG